MAVSNRDRIGRMFELLAPALDDFIARSVAPQLPEGASWTALVAMKDKKKGIEGKEYHRLDPQVQLRMPTENIPHNLKPGWYPFDDAVGRVGQGYSKELREARNEWAHNKSFSDDDAYWTSPRSRMAHPAIPANRRPTPSWLQLVGEVDSGGRQGHQSQPQFVKDEVMLTGERPDCHVGEVGGA